MGDLRRLERLEPENEVCDRRSTCEEPQGVGFKASQSIPLAKSRTCNLCMRPSCVQMMLANVIGSGNNSRRTSTYRTDQPHRPNSSTAIPASATISPTECFRSPQQRRRRSGACPIPCRVIWGTWVSLQLIGLAASPDAVRREGVSALCKVNNHRVGHEALCASNRRNGEGQGDDCGCHDRLHFLFSLLSLLLFLHRRVAAAATYIQFGTDRSKSHTAHINESSGLVRCWPAAITA